MSGRRWLPVLKQAAAGWMEDEAPSKGAALAYYSMFSMAPLLFIMKSDGRGRRRSRAGNACPVSEPKTGIWAMLGVALVIFGATTVFAQLQAALDAIWEVPAQAAKLEKPNAIWTFIKGRLLSFGLVLGLAFLMVVSLLSANGKRWRIYSTWRSASAC